MPLRFSLPLGIILTGALCSHALAAPFVMNGKAYDVVGVAGSGAHKSLLELDFGTNASPDVHLFGYQWGAATPNGRTLLSDLQNASLGLTFTDTYYAAFDSYLLNTLWFNASQPANDYPNAFWLWFTAPAGQGWSEAILGYDATPLADGGSYAWALQHDDPNIAHDYSDPNSPFLPASHYPAPLAAIPEPVSLGLMLPAAVLLLRRRR